MRKTLCLLLAFTLPSLSGAQTPSAIDQYQQEREEFLLATKALSKGKRNSFSQHKKNLRNYPLHPYLEYLEIASDLRRAKSDTVDEFLTINQGTILAHRMRRTWLHYLRKKDRADQFVKYYLADSATTEQQCYYHLTQYRNGAKKEALEAGIQLWIVGKSQPKSCDKLFGILIKNNIITEDIAWQRYTSAVINHETKLARYLKRFFTSSAYKTKVDLYYSAHKKPATIKQHELFTDTSPPTQALIEHGVKHLADTESMSALAQWKHYKKQLNFNEEQISSITNTLVKALHKQNHMGIADDLLSNAEHAHSSLLEWRIREALRTMDWASVRYWIRKLPQTAQDYDRWKYWLAKAEDKLSPSNANTTQQQLATIAKERSYYGFLAADQTQQPYQLNNQPSIIAPELLAQASNNPALIRSRELYLLGDNLNARREWKHATDAQKSDFMLAASKLTSDWGWHAQAAYGVVRVKQWDDLDLRFPSDFIPLYIKYSSKQKLPLELMLALSRQESSFATDALSPSGAKGLMQLMPPTAKYIARKKGISYRSQKQLHEAEKNIELGTSYYRYLMDDFNNNRILSTASYNAGPNRVKKWLAESDGQLPADIWIELIPYTETRRYVQNVLYFSVVYGLRGMNEKTVLLTQDEINTKL